MRQALDSGIIQLSMKVRNGESIKDFKSDDALVLPQSAFAENMLTWGDITLCATNATRIALNTTTRRLLGKDNQLITDNEKVINMHNEWDWVSTGGNALTNGCIGYLSNAYTSFLPTPRQLMIPGSRIPIIRAQFKTDLGDDFGEILLDKQCLADGNPLLTSKQKYVAKHKKMAIPFEFTYGYAITCHRAQGSEWDKVLVVEERFPFDKEEHKRWVYTACTRAAKKLVLITKD